MTSIGALAALLLAWLPRDPEHAPPCTVRGLLPDPSCTSGLVDTTDLKVICGQSTHERRAVTEATKRQVFLEYGLDPRPPHGPAEAYEVDHLIPLELGGSNDIRNLWPEAAPGFRVKDRLENELHRRVCDGQMRLEDAQREIAADWTGVK
jgi:hypothetical protein